MTGPGLRLSCDIRPDFQPVDEAGKGAGTVRLLELADGFGLDLADAFARDAEYFADLFERVGVTVGQAVPQPQDFPLAVVEALHGLVDPPLEGLLVRVV